MTDDGRELTHWLARRLESLDNVKLASALEPQVLEVERKKYADTVVGVVSAARVTRDTIAGLVEKPHDLEFIVNVPKEGFWTGEALDFAESRGSAAGGVSELYSAMNARSVSAFTPPEYAFFKRIMGQHSNVSGIERFADRKYIVETLDGRNVAVVLLNEYELSADRVRTAREWYWPFNAILATNPNGRPTSEADDAASSMGVRIFKLRQFMGMLKGGS